MEKKVGFSVGAFLLTLAFFWIVFDNVALGLIFGFFAVGIAASRAQARDKEA